MQKRGKDPNKRALDSPQLLQGLLRKIQGLDQMYLGKAKAPRKKFSRRHDLSKRVLENPKRIKRENSVEWLSASSIVDPNLKNFGEIAHIDSMEGFVSVSEEQQNNMYESYREFLTEYYMKH